MIERDGYIRQSAATAVMNEFLIVIGEEMGLEHGVTELRLASKLDMLKAVDQRPELQHLVEQLVFRVANYFSDQDYGGV